MSIRRFLIGALATVAMLAAMVGSAAACTAIVTAGDCGKVHITVESAAHWEIVLTGGSGAGVYTFKLDGNVTIDEPVAPGTYDWSSRYTNDGTNWTGAQSGHVIVRACPSIATTLSGSSVAIGTAVHDSATLSGATANASGSVTYTVYTDNECTAGPQSAGTVTVTGGVVPNSNAITFNSAGTWYWRAVYSGDANNKGATSACTSEILVVSPSPVESFQGETATPVVTSTPFESIGGETATPAKTATPPPTSTGSGSSSNSSTPLSALLICLAFGGLGLAAVEAQRRTIRR